VADLIVCIVVDILGLVAIKNLKSFRVARVPPSGSRKLVVLGSSQFPVFYSQIALKDFGRAQEPQDCSIASGQAAASICTSIAIPLLRLGFGHQ
jgi:hypothetical protein